MSWEKLFGQGGAPVMTMADVNALKDTRATNETHLARYQAAFDKGVRKVLDVQCPECAASALKSCHRGV